MIFAGRNGSGHCRDATTLRDSLVGLIEPMVRSAVFGAGRGQRSMGSVLGNAS